MIAAGLLMVAEHTVTQLQPLLSSLNKSWVLQLCDLYENDCIFDKFDCAISGNGQYVTTGSYNNFLKVTGRQGGPETIVEASRDPLRKRLQPQAKVQRPVSHQLPSPALTLLAVLRSWYLMLLCTICKC